MIDRPPGSLTVMRRDASSALASRRMVDDQPRSRPIVDVCGWEVVLADGSSLGVIDHYLFDEASNRPRYLAVAPVDREGHVLIPVGAGTLDPAHRRLRLKKQRADRLRSLPLLTSDTLTTEIECAVYEAVTGKRVSRVALPRLHGDPIFDATRLIGRPRRNTGR